VTAHILDEVDSDGSGEVEYEEFVQISMTSTLAKLEMKGQGSNEQAGPAAPERQPGGAADCALTVRAGSGVCLVLPLSTARMAQCHDWHRAGMKLMLCLAVGCWEPLLQQCFGLAAGSVRAWLTSGGDRSWVRPDSVVGQPGCWCLCPVDLFSGSLTRSSQL